jgi:MFS family permease
VLSVATGFAARAGIPRGRPIHAMDTTERTSLHGLLLILRQRRLVGIWFYAALVSFSVQGLLLATLVLLVDQRGISIAGFGAEGSAGLLLAILMLAYAVTSLLTGRRLDAVRRRTSLLGMTIALLVAGYVLLAFTPALTVIVVALGAIVVPLLTLIGDLAAPELRGRATAIYQVAADLGGTAGPIVGLILGVRFGFFAIYGGVAALFALSFPMAIALVRTERHHQRHSAPED